VSDQLHTRSFYCHERITVPTERDGLWALGRARTIWRRTKYYGPTGIRNLYRPVHNTVTILTGIFRLPRVSQYRDQSIVLPARLFRKSRTRYLLHYHLPSIKEEIKSRLKSRNACYHSVQNLLSSGLFYKNLKSKLYRTIMLPVILYGCETWSLTLTEERKLTVP
jgi:hypothetical protein